MQKVLIFILLAILIPSFGQAKESDILKGECASSYDSTIHKEIYTLVDSMPKYPGGFKALLSFFSKNFIYPKDQEEFQATIFLTFIIEEDGKLSNISTAKNLDEAIWSRVDREAIRVFHLMPLWTPGQCKGKNVAVKLTLPIKF
ncbi:MAG: hypothetical protein ABI855_02220 [Bacteroidota bacterium]